MDKERVRTARGYRPGSAMTSGSTAIVTTRSVDIHNKPRPITALGGIESTLTTSSMTLSSSRQVQDVNYFVCLLKNKEMSIENETKRIQQHLEKMDVEIASLPALKESHRVTLHEVTALEQSLSDYSLAIEKTRRRSNLTEIQTMSRQVLIENEALSKETDELFKKRQKQLREIEDIEKDVSNKHNYLLRSFHAVDPSKRELFHELLLQMNACQSEKKRLEHVIEDLSEKKNFLLSQLQHADGHGKEYNHVCSEVEKVRTEIYRFDDVLRLFTMETDDAHKILEERIQADRDRLDELMCDESIIDDNIQSLGVRKQALLKRIHELDQESEKSGLLVNEYMELVRIENIISRKVEDAQAECDRMSNHLFASKAQTVKLLNDMSSLITKSQSAAPSQNEIRKFKNVLDFQQKNLQKTQQTIDRLNYEKEKRKLEVIKTEQLEERIQEELRDLNAKIDKMNKDILVYDDLQSLQDSADLSHDYLSQMKERYQRRFDFINARVIQMETELQKYENELNGSEIWSNLRCLQNNLKQSGEALYCLQQSILLKNLETNYLNVKNNCFMIVEALNDTLATQKRSI